jgi:hypothetical protein
MTEPEPLAVFDVHENNWQGLPARARDRINDWARGEGLDPNDIYRVETYVIDCPFVRVFAFARDAAGNKFLGEDGVNPARLPPRDVPVSSLPPVEPWKGDAAP